VIDSLPPHFNAAIYRRCSITSVWRLNMVFENTIPQAQEELSEKLARNIPTRVF
jgi:hypothetical protein